MKKKAKIKYYQMETNEPERSASLVVFGDITSYPYADSDVSAYNLQQEIQALDVDSIDVHINSYGGEVAEALAIANTLMRHKAKVTTYVDGFACSAATIIFMAGDERIVSPASNFLVHPASSMICGNAEDLRREADNLDTITAQSINMYMRGVTKTKEELIELMSLEKFLTPEEVLEWGFATKLDAFGEDEDEEDKDEDEGEETDEGENTDEGEDEETDEETDEGDEDEDEEDDEEEEPPTQSVRQLVSNMLLDRQKQETVRIDNRQMKELSQMITKQMITELSKVQPEKAEVAPVQPEKTILNNFLKAFR